VNLRPAQAGVARILNFFRRRREYFLFSSILVAVICTGGAFLLPPKYEASTIIMVQREEVMIPLVTMGGDFAMSTDDRFGTFNEITFSRAAVETVIDSLHLDKDIKTEDEREELIKRVRKNIRTTKPGEATYEIMFYDSDPIRAQLGDYILARYFIRTILLVENKRNEVALDFFQEKLDEMHQRYDRKQAEMVSLMRSRIHEMPVQNRTLLDNLDAIEKKNSAIDERMKRDTRILDMLQHLTPGLATENDKQLLQKLDALDFPSATDLKYLVDTYTDLTRRYTPKYPEVLKTIKKINSLLVIVKDGIVQDTVDQNNLRVQLQQQKAQAVEDLKQKSTVQEIDSDEKADLEFSRKLYDEMSVKVEQARQTRDLGSKGSEQFIIIDPPIVPTEPTQPDKLDIIINGIILGLLMGVLSAGCKELLDPTIRTIHDIGTFQKGVVAFIPGKAIQRIERLPKQS
jgi:polysaccharide biosynthesis transport protein